MFSLRPYQKQILDDVYSAFEEVDSALVVSPTGSGKTVIFAEAMHAHDGATAAVVHRREIVKQISCALAAADTPHRIVAPSKTIQMIRRAHLKLCGHSYVDPAGSAGVASVQTLTSQSTSRDTRTQAWLQQVSLSVLDEAHHYKQSGVWGRALDVLSSAKTLGVTACPERADGIGLGREYGGWADVLIEGPQAYDLIKQGYLSPYAYKAPESDLDVSGLAVGKAGEFNPKDLRKRVVVSHLVGDVVTHYQRHASGKQAIVFATDVRSAEDIADALKSAGVAAAAVSGETDDDIRDRAMRDFEARTLQVLVNVDLFDEGLDVPGVEAVILARPTESLNKFLQMCGRALRPVFAAGYRLDSVAQRLDAIAAGPKPKAIIIDMVRNWERHGQPNWRRAWSLMGSRSERESTGTRPQRVCLGCTQPYDRVLSECPYCGEPAPPPSDRSTPEAVDGALVDLDVEAMAELVNRIQTADMSDEDFERQALAKHMPRVGIAAHLKRHRVAKYRRGVLKEVIAWWCGAQPGRSQREIQKRFHFRFGIDMGKALTLSAKDTDALIAVIQSRFGEDIRQDD